MKGCQHGMYTIEDAADVHIWAHLLLSRSSMFTLLTVKLSPCTWCMPPEMGLREYEGFYQSICFTKANKIQSCCD